MEQQRFGAAHLSGNVAVAHRLPRLSLERSHLRGQLTDNVLGPGEVVLGGPQADVYKRQVKKIAPENVPRESTAQPRSIGFVCGRDASV